MVRVELIRLCAERRSQCSSKSPRSTMARRLIETISKHPIIHSVGFMSWPLKVVERALKLLKGRKLIMMRQLFLSDGFAEISKASRFFFKGAFGGLR